MNEKDRLSILEQIERGEISIEDAEAELAKAIEEPITVEESEEIYVPTRRERKLALAESIKDWQLHTMPGLGTDDDVVWEWPWPDSNWQWVWQNLGHPVHVSHSIDIEDESELLIVLYQGDLFIRGWDEPNLKINGAVFDTRTGQDRNIVRIASSTGQLHVWVPRNITRVNARVEPGDMWLSNVSADVDARCKSGDLGCEWVSGNIKIQVNGGDARLIEIEGPIDVKVIRGNTDIRNISSTDVSLKTTEGNIWLSLDSVKGGRFRCESTKGDVNLLTNGELSCELIVETTDGGMISPTILPWQKLLQRSEGRLHGILMGGGAQISLLARDGKIYIQESQISTFSMPPSD
ncbi:DUF4097 family beta strand repeat-containing protein [Candidatus Poribacteria bacterium]